MRLQINSHHIRDGTVVLEAAALPMSYTPVPAGGIEIQDDRPMCRHC
jgi:hypothetical protein